MRIAVSGYANLDYVIGLAGAPQPNRTVLLSSRADAWPRPGGGPIYICAAIQRAGGVDVSLISWVGSDLAGSDYVRHLAGLGLPTEGVARSLWGGTPICILAYAPGGACYCLSEAMTTAEAEYDAGQLALIDAADWVCLTAQPAAAARAALERISERQYLIWAARDPAAFPEKLRRDLAARADLVVHSLGDRDFVAPYLATTPGRPDRLVVETHGAVGATLTTRGRTFRAPIEKAKRVKTNDPTGVGDTFVGGLLAALIAKREPLAAVRAGEAAAQGMLMARNELTAART